MTTLLNNAEGGSSGTTVTTANSGGASGTAFDAVVIGTGCSQTFDNTVAAHGVRAYKFSTGSTVTNTRFSWEASLGTITTAVWFRAYYYFTANPAAAIRILSFNTTANAACAEIQLNTNGTLTFQNAAGTAITGMTTTNSINLNGWTRIEGFVTGSTTVGQVSVSMYKTMDSPTATETKTSAASQVLGANVGKAFFGTIANVANVAAFWIDDVGVSTVGALGPSLTLDTDTGSGAEGQSVFLSDTDTGTGLDRAWWGGDFAHGNEGQSIYLSAADVGSGAEVQGTTVTLPGLDTGSGADATGTVKASLSSSDTSSGTEALALGITLADSGSGTDAGTLAATSAGSDTGSGVEIFVLRISQTDIGSGTDAGSSAATSAGSDTGSGSEAQKVSASVPGTDGGLFFKANNFESGTNGSAISIANSGGPQVTAFENVYVSSGTGTMTYDNSKAFSGNLAMRFNTTSGSCVESVYWTVPVPSSGHLYSRCYVNLDSLPSLSAPLVSFYGQTGIWGMKVNSSGHVAASVTGIADIAGTTVLSTGTWYRIETDFFIGDGSSAQTIVRLYDSGGSLLETVSSGANGTGSYTSALIQSFYFGNANGYVFAGNIDDVAVTDYAWIGTGSYGATESGSIGVVLPDTGSGTDTGSLAATVAGSDTGSGADTSTLGVMLADSGSGSESQGTTASLSSADTGSGTEAGTLAATAAAPDTGSGADASILGIALADNGSGSESQGTTASLSSADTGSGADTLILGVSLADLGSGSESQGADASLSSLDTGFGSEFQLAVVAVPDLDTGSGAEGSVVVFVASADFGTGTESQSVATGVVSISDSDTGTGSESAGPVGVSLADTGAGSESQGLAVISADLDTGSVQDAGNVLGTSTPHGIDAGASSEVQQVTAVLSDTDAGTGSEAQFLVLFSVDSGSSSESQGTTAVLVSLDSGVGSDIGFVVGRTQSIFGSDTGSGTDAVTAVSMSVSDVVYGSDASLTLIAVTDSGVGSEFWSLAASVASSDLGTGADTAPAPGSVSYPAGTDSGSGSDTWLLRLASSDRASATESQAVPGQTVYIADGDFSRGIEGLMAEWGTGWGAVDLDLYAARLRVEQEALGTGLILRAEPRW